MKDKINVAIGTIKNKLGICCCTGCFHKSVAHIELPQVNVKRELCDKHLKELQKELSGRTIIMEVEQ